MTTIYNSNYGGTSPFSDTCGQVGLNANAEKTYAVPGAAIVQYQVTFGYNASENIYVRLNNTPTIPTLGTVGTESYSLFRPEKCYVRGGDVIHFITPDTTAYFGFSLMQVQG